jgi:hypothetical protein
MDTIAHIAESCFHEKLTKFSPALRYENQQYLSTQFSPKTAELIDNFL